MKTGKMRSAVGLAVRLLGIMGMFLLPSAARAQDCGPQGEGDCNECGPHYEAWTALACGSLTNTPSVSPAQFSQFSGTAPNVPTNVVFPGYSDGWEQRTVTMDCPEWRAFSETTNISYTHGPLLWNPPLPAILTNSFSSSAYVISYSSDASVCPNITNTLGAVSWCVATVTNNCTPGTVTLNITSTNTNFCYTFPVTLSTTTNITNSVIVFTTNCPCNTNLDGNFTTNVPPTIVSNWWTVSGPGDYTNRGSGRTATFTPTNAAGAGTVYFNAAYSNNTPCHPGVQYAPVCSIPFNLTLAMNILDANSKPISSANSNNVVIVGQNITLNAVSASPCSQTFSNFEWSVDGTVYTNFYISTDSLQTNGYPTPLTNTNSQNIACFWVDGGTKNVSCSAICGGTTCSTNVAFTVVRPTFSVSTTKGSVAVGTNGGGALNMLFGNANPGPVGISLSWTMVSFPLNNSSVKLGWCQLITSNLDIITTISNIVTNIVKITNNVTNIVNVTNCVTNVIPHTNETVGTVLDGIFPYPCYPDGHADDSPSIALFVNNETGAFDTLSATMWLMIQPTTNNGVPVSGNWVPANTTAWSCAGTAAGFGTNASNWSLSRTNISVLTNGDSGITYPIWTNNATNFIQYHPPIN
jgi:hypothetical protein